MAPEDVVFLPATAAETVTTSETSNATDRQSRMRRFVLVSILSNKEVRWVVSLVECQWTTTSLNKRMRIAYFINY